MVWWVVKTNFSVYLRSQFWVEVGVGVRPDLTRPDLTWPDQTWPDLIWPHLTWPCPDLDLKWDLEWDLELDILIFQQFIFFFSINYFLSKNPIFLLILLQNSPGVDAAVDTYLLWPSCDLHLEGVHIVQVGHPCDHADRATFPWKQRPHQNNVQLTEKWVSRDSSGSLKSWELGDNLVTGLLCLVRPHHTKLFKTFQDGMNWTFPGHKSFIWTLTFSFCCQVENSQ